MAANKVAIENAIPIYDPNIKWCDLGKDYRGYEISNTGILRSMKFPKAYPFGILINPDMNGLYELSDSSNRRVRLTMGDILNICKGKPYSIETCIPLRNSRNQLMGSKSRYLEKKKESLIKQDAMNNTPCPIQIGSSK